MFLKTFWDYWKKFGRILGRIQTTIILTIIYFLVLSPIGILKQIFTRKKKLSTYWIDISTQKHSLKEAYEQY